MPTQRTFGLSKAGTHQNRNPLSLPRAPRRDPTFDHKIYHQSSRSSRHNNLSISNQLCNWNMWNAPPLPIRRFQVCSLTLVASPPSFALLTNDGVEVAPTRGIRNLENGNFLISQDVSEYRSKYAIPDLTRTTNYPIILCERQFCSEVVRTHTMGLSKEQGNLFHSAGFLPSAMRSTPNVAEYLRGFFMQ